MQFKVGDKVHVVKDYKKLLEKGEYDLKLQKIFALEEEELTIVEKYEDEDCYLVKGKNGEATLEEKFFEEYNRKGIMSNKEFVWFVNFIRPFKEQVKWVMLERGVLGSCYLAIGYVSELNVLEKIVLPISLNRLYEGGFKSMEKNKFYSLEQLGIL